MPADDARSRSAHTHTPFDPVWSAALKDADVYARMLFSAPGLRMLFVSWPWAAAFRIARYAKDSPADTRATVRLLFWRYERTLADTGTRWVGR
jgi:hypothetical protein